MHYVRMKEIGKVAIPREGTPEWQILQKQIKDNENNPFLKEYSKKIINEAVATCEVQKLNGAGLPADTLLPYIPARLSEGLRLKLLSLFTNYLSPILT